MQRSMLWVAGATLNIALVSVSMAQAPAAESGEVALEEVTVTAQKREENAQKTAISIATVQREEIEQRGINSLDQALRTVSGVRMQTSAQGGAGIFIRGVGNNEIDATLTYQPAVAVNVDGVSNNQPGNVLDSMLDVERVEVLRGPQGTLYGASAEGGVVNVVLAQPKNEFEVRGRVQVGNYNARQLEGVLNVPLGDKLALRFTGSNNKRDGYVDGPEIYLATCPPAGMGAPETGVCQDNPLGAVGNNSLSIPNPGGNHGALDTTSYRVKAKFDPAEWLSMTGTYEHSKTEGTYVQAISYANLRANNWYVNARRLDSGSKVDVYSANIVATLGTFGELSLIPSRRTTQNFVNPLLGTPGPAKLSQDTYEARLSSLASSKTKWTVGGYSSKAGSNLAGATPSAASPMTGTGAYNGYGLLSVNRPFDNWNVFGQATYPITDVLRVTAGARYTHSESGYGFLLYQARTVGSTLVVDNSTTYGQTTSVNNTTYKLGMEYDLAPESMVYAQIATGFKAGGLGLAPDAMSAAVINGPQDVQLRTYKSEESTTFEIGSKNRFLDDRLQLNASAFLNKWKNMQVQSWVCFDASGVCAFFTPGVTGFSQVVYNADTSTQYGLELDLTWLATANDKVNVSVSSMRGKYGTLVLQSFDGAHVLTDHDMSNSPALTGNLGYEHNFRFAGLTLTPRIDEQFSTKYWNTHEYWFSGIPPSNPPQNQALTPGYHKTDASLTLAGKKWSVNAYARNIWNKATAQYVYPNGTAVADPRVVGVGITGAY